LTFRRPIYRILFFAAWIVVLGAITTLVIAANRKTESRTCKGVEIAINNNGDKIFVEKADVLKAIETTAKGPLVNKQFASINLAALERTLEANPWIRDAELYFDSKDALHVSISEREPFARVFTTAGNSYYMDSAGYQLPLLQTYRAKLPVVTGFTAAKKFSKRDSATLKGLKEVVRFVSNDKFWNVQVGQIDITPEGKFELVPLIGSHIIKLGYGENIEQKLANLMVFYKQVLPKAGFTKYRALDVQYEGQVVAVKKGSTSKIDSIQLQKNIEELMRKKAVEQEPEDFAVAVPMKTNTQSVSERDSVANQPPKTVPLKTTVLPKKTIVLKPNPNKQPKAVMPGKNED
jgi:cell division protein FtsQ